MRSFWRAAATVGVVSSQALLAASASSGEIASDDANAAGGLAGEGGAAAAVAVAEPRKSSAEEGLPRLPWLEEGYLSWEYDGYKINYVDEGDKSKVHTDGVFRHQGSRFVFVLCFCICFGDRMRCFIVLYLVVAKL